MSKVLQLGYPLVPLPERKDGTKRPATFNHYTSWDEICDIFKSAHSAYEMNDIRFEATEYMVVGRDYSDQEAEVGVQVDDVFQTLVVFHAMKPPSPKTRHKMQKKIAIRGYRKISHGAVTIDMFRDENGRLPDQMYDVLAEEAENGELDDNYNGPEWWLQFDWGLKAFEDNMSRLRAAERKRKVYRKVNGR